MKLSRRSFLKTSLAASSAFSLSPHSWAQVEGSNSDVRVAVIGFNGRGGDHMKEIAKLGRHHILT